MFRASARYLGFTLLAVGLACSSALAEPIKGAMVLQAIYFREAGFAVLGRTNLPRGAHVLISFSRSDGHLIGDEIATVGEFGRFYAGPFAVGNFHAPDGRYVVDATVPVVTAQPKLVAMLAGHNWENFAGPLIDERSAQGRSPVLAFTFAYRKEDGPWYLYELKVPDDSSLVLAPADQHWATASLDRRIAARQAEDIRNAPLAFEACQDWIKLDLRHPRSVEFLDKFSWVRIGKINGDFAVRQRVRAKNIYGRQGVAEFFCRLRLADDGHWNLVNIREL